MNTIAVTASENEGPMETKGPIIPFASIACAQTPNTRTESRSIAKLSEWTMMY